LSQNLTLQRAQSLTETRLQSILKQMFHDIGSADTKASIVLAIAAAIASVVSVDNPLEHISVSTGRDILKGVLGFAHLFAVGSIACAVLAVLPRGRIPRWEKFRSISVIRDKSAYAHDPLSARTDLGEQIAQLPINHIDIAKYESGEKFLQNFRAHTIGLNAPESAEYREIENALAQDIIRTSHLSFVKHRWVLWAVVWLGLETTTFLLAAILRIGLL